MIKIFWRAVVLFWVAGFRVCCADLPEPATPRRVPLAMISRNCDISNDVISPLQFLKIDRFEVSKGFLYVTALGLNYQGPIYPRDDIATKALAFIRLDDLEVFIDSFYVGVGLVIKIDPKIKKTSLTLE